MDKVLERLKELKDEESRYAYADAVTNAFLAGQIKALQEERDLTQEQLAALIGTKQSGISRWLNTGFSTCKIETLRKFAKAYGVRLRISFEDFGSLPDDLRRFDAKHLAPPRFEEDPAFGLASPNKSDQPTAVETLAAFYSPYVGAAMDALHPAEQDRQDVPAYKCQPVVVYIDSSVIKQSEFMESIRTAEPKENTDGTAAA